MDADSIIINPSIALETFLPPAGYEHIHFIGNKDHNGLNTGTFFLRVHEWSVRLMAKTVAYPMYRPDQDLGRSADQNAMAILFNETEFQKSVLFQPRLWYNTYQFKHGYEGTRGRLLVHFAGLESPRMGLMDKWLDTVEQRPQEWTVDIDQTMYPAEIREYWSMLAQAQDILHRAQELLAHRNEQRQQDDTKDDGKDEESRQAITNTQKAAERLTLVLATESDRLEAVKDAKDELDRATARIVPPSP